MLKTSGVIGLVLLARWSWPCFHSSKRLLRPSPARKKAGMGVQSDALEVEAAARFLNILLMNHFLFCFPLLYANKYWTLSQCVCFWEKYGNNSLVWSTYNWPFFFHCARQFYFHVKNWPDCIFTLFFPLPTIPMGRRLSFLSLHYFSPWKP